MAKWKLPEGRKPLTDADMAALTHRLADTAIEQSELYQAAKRDAEEAEAYAAEMEAKLAKAVEALELALDLADNGLVDFDKYCLSCDADINERYRATLAELKRTGR
jgi:hypothetical protein